MTLQLIKSKWRATLLECTQSADYLLIVCPFIKASVIKELLATFPAKRVEVITRMNTADFYDGVSDTEAIRILLESGAQVRALKGLHTKLYIFDDTKAIVGSANLTASALDTNFELGHLTTDEDAVFECIEYFDELWEKAANDVTLELVDKCDQILQTAQNAERPKHPSGLKDFGTQTSPKLPKDVLAYLQNRGPKELLLHYLKLVGRISKLRRASINKPENNSYVVHDVKCNSGKAINFIEFTAAKSRETKKFRYAMRFSINADYNDPLSLLSEASEAYGHLRLSFDFDENTDLDYAFDLAKTSYGMTQGHR